MGTRELCEKCDCFFIIGQQDDQCPHGQIEDIEENTDEVIHKAIKDAVEAVDDEWKEKYREIEHENEKYEQRIMQLYNQNESLKSKLQQVKKYAQENKDKELFDLIIWEILNFEVKETKNAKK